jgi:hypothetical protein
MGLRSPLAGLFQKSGAGMIKFFRRIRQNLLAEGKTGKYLKYAFGEVVLVVIGILIALSINNWNENQKLLKEEKKLLGALVREIESNLASLEQTIQKNDTIFQQSSRFLTKGLNNPEFEYDIDDLLLVLGYAVNDLDTSIINEILGTNSRALISNDSILEQIRTLKKMYERAEKTQFYADTFWNGQIIPYLNSSGLGVYLSQVDPKEKNAFEVTLGTSFFSPLGMTNGYQSALLQSGNDLKNELEETLAVLNKD